MTSAIEIPDPEKLASIYTPVELAILYDWLRFPRPRSLASVDVRDSGEDDPEDDDEYGTRRALRVEPSIYGHYNEQSLNNAVARLVLSKIQHRLPQWALVNGRGEVFLARKPHAKREAAIELMPQFLFEINWADSGPGYSWPEAYHATYLPGFDRFVVTASQDSPDMHGYTEEAIGQFPAGHDLKAASGAEIVGWWAGQASDGLQQRWEYVFTCGLFDLDEIDRLADRVWDADSGEPLAAMATADAGISPA